MSFEGHIEKGVVVFDEPVSLAEGAKVRVELVSSSTNLAPSAKPLSVEPRDDWERRLFGAAIDCGVSIPDSALSSDGLYE
jgi:hypothetical protein